MYQASQPANKCFKINTNVWYFKTEFDSRKRVRIWTYLIELQQRRVLDAFQWTPQLAKHTCRRACFFQIALKNRLKWVRRFLFFSRLYWSRFLIDNSKIESNSWIYVTVFFVMVNIDGRNELVGWNISWLSSIKYLIQMNKRMMKFCERFTG